jgi:hypothetical protein
MLVLDIIWCDLLNDNNIFTRNFYILIMDRYNVKTKPKKKKANICTLEKHCIFWNYWETFGLFLDLYIHFFFNLSDYLDFWKIIQGHNCKFDFIGVTGQQGMLTPPWHLIPPPIYSEVVYAHSLICISYRAYEIDY